MKDIHPLYAKILNQLLDLDQRKSMPEKEKRFSELAGLITDDSEVDTDVFEIDPEKYDT